jgi:catechol 2,3-dioxygenase-like lactoylglutathione lyase family enzyme
MQSIISHVSVGVSDLARARSFYDAVMAALGYGVVMEHDDHGVAYGVSFPEYWIVKPLDGRPPVPGNGVHFGFLAPSREAVDAFHAAGLDHGGTCHGPPGLRPEYTPTYYAAFLRDPDGNAIEAMLI